MGLSKSPADMSERELLDALQEGLPTGNSMGVLQIAVEMGLGDGAASVEELELLNAYLSIWMKTNQHSLAMTPREIPLSQYFHPNGDPNTAKIKELTGAVIKNREQLVGQIRPAVEGILNVAA